jgi:acetyl-CoA carboxylase biotin carboxyl carrier protein
MWDDLRCDDLPQGSSSSTRGNAARERRRAAAIRVGSRTRAVDVCAHITGTVWKIEVKPGDEVAEEQSLVILESMKMEMPVEAPQAGRVLEVKVSEGEAVEEGDVLVTLRVEGE